MEVLSYIIIASFIISLGALALEKILLFLVSLSAGALMGGAFIHLLP